MTVNDLYQKIGEQNRPEEEINLIKKAYDFAAAAHHGQKRKSGAPYITHPLGTALHLTDMGLDTQSIAAALLHDVCEDTNHTIQEIRTQFGDTIAFLVEGVTKLDKVRYRGNSRSAESLRKMFLAIAEDIRIVLIKLVDRLNNMETLQFLPPEKQKRIALETLEIYAPLAYRLGIGELKGQLEDIAFKYVHPDQYAWLSKTLREHFDERHTYIEQLKPLVANELTKENIGFRDIHARAKHAYSLYRKLIKYDMDIDKVYDLLAIRIVVESIEDCYGALGIVHKLWKPVPGLVKDYISLPKPNGYRSVHTTVFGP
ncbi:MAG: HD domain-containing protein, partial [Candidatus Sungbacteria bacterium]|nr:HD domain-containing protein [Candidatus Sungbacteria bacterium]